MKKLKFLALLLAAAMLLSAMGGAVQAAGSTIRVTSAEQLILLSERCRLDSWSQGKTVVLTNDIDLTGRDFEPIPTFGGTFEGNGYTIRGLNISDSGSAVGGLFRYVQEGAVIRELNVEGTIEPQTNAERFGGIAGENSGRIINCSFTGNVSGSSQIGGIVGLNRVTGELYGCRSTGSVSGEHYTGGIAGRNEGSIINCTNIANVNTTNAEFVAEELDINWQDLNSTENVAVHTDTGGITGYSQGILEGCSNRGNVGYPHVGYNVGGVAGRQSGYMNDCENHGTVNGRKDVGGVVGQMVPAIRMQFSSSAIADLRAEMNTLQGFIDDMISDVQGSSAEISGILTSAGGYLSSAGESAGFIGEALVSFVNDNMESANTLTATIARYAGKLAPALDYLEGGLGNIGGASAVLSDIIARLQGNGGEYAAVLPHAEYAAARLDESKTAVDGAKALVNQALAQLIEAVERGDDTESLAKLAGDSIEKMRTAAQQLVSAAETVADALEKGVKPAFEELVKIAPQPGELGDSLQSVMDSLSGAGSGLGSAMGALEGWVSDLGREEPIVLKGFGEEFTEEADRMDAAFVGLSGDMERLNAAVSGSSAVITADLQAVNKQFFRVMDSFMALLDSSESEVSVYEDMSEEELFTATEGKVEACVNRGTVAGDVNVGGLVGTMAIEYDLDPEEDISVSDSRGGTFRYLTNAALLSCVNYESVTGKKDGAGGAVGYMDLGLVYGCENYGSVASTSGDYVGGIAGRSAASVKNCWALCSLSGRDYVGGIAGSGTDVSGCRAIVQISSGGGWQGAIAGEALGETAENYFVGEGQGGIDGVSYAGKAEPQTYADFILAEGLPGQFLNFNLAFVSENIMVERVNFSYGDSIDPEDIPEVPAKEGHVGAWEDFDFSKLSFSGTVEAVYTPYDAVVAVTDELGKRPIVLLEGAFLPGTVPDLRLAEKSLKTPEGTLESWTVTVEGSMEDTYLVRYLAPAKIENVLIYVLRDGAWQVVSAETQSSYLVFEAGGESLTFAAVEAEESFPVLWAAIGGGAALLLLVLALVLRSRAKKKKLLQAAAE